MIVERARPEELGEVLAVLAESARWLRSRGIEQWPDPFPPDRVEPSIARGETYLVRVGGAVAHAIAVRREFAGLGPKLLDWAAARVREARRDFLRLDCLSENTALRSYYERHGFVYCRDTDVDEFRTSLYERRCA